MVCYDVEVRLRQRVTMIYGLMASQSSDCFDQGWIWSTRGLYLEGWQDTECETWISVNTIEKSVPEDGACVGALVTTEGVRI